MRYPHKAFEECRRRRRYLKYYPVGLNIDGKDVLIIGAGSVAERKIRLLLAFGARIRVVAPSATRHIENLASKRVITLIKRKYRASDMGRARLVIAATSDRRANEMVCSDAKKNNILVNVADSTALCDFISPAVIRRRGLVISVSTDAKNPVLSKEFKDFLKRKIDEFRSGRD
ncbi:MAG: bifunctional precorrin-2 dehydrogenase/sirohydrochlorin ferrochelatase [Candidatus Omnitrophica bacterium]|nr:bifunctional precorrin-2 dehydrogenase/sirohydrochlorin ferrochelatase [Candidatus Omnitrophota bacterium]